MTVRLSEQEKQAVQTIYFHLQLRFSIILNRLKKRTKFDFVFDTYVPKSDPEVFHSELHVSVITSTEDAY